jgi:accessory colonization factor AcfC
MAEVGYSGTPLIKKLGIKPEMKIMVIHDPEEYFDLLGVNVSDQYFSKNEVPDFIHLFAKNIAVFKKEMAGVLKFCKKNPTIIIWVSWYKKSSGISTDLSENIIREFALKNSLVDVKVCAVSEVWSGLKLVVPIAKR